MGTLSHSSNYGYHPAGHNSRFAGLIFVVGLHVLLVYGLMMGMHRDVIKLLPKSMTMVNVPQIDIPPPPPIPIKTLIPPTNTSTAKAPDVPEFIPEPAFKSESSGLSIASDPTPRQADIVIQPPATPVQAKPAAATTAIGLACPYMVAPEMPRKAMQDGVTGLVRATALIRGGAVVAVTDITGPRVFHAAVRTAMQQYRCNVSAGEVSATQEFSFRLED